MSEIETDQSPHQSLVTPAVIESLLTHIMDVTGIKHPRDIRDVLLAALISIYKNFRSDEPTIEWIADDVRELISNSILLPETLNS